MAASLILIILIIFKSSAHCTSICCCKNQYTNVHFYIDFYTDFKPATITRRTVDSMLQHYNKVLGFEFRYSSHDYRRTHISLLSALGMPLKDIQHQVRHSSPDMTLKYLRNNRDTKEILSDLNQLFKNIDFSA